MSGSDEADRPRSTAMTAGQVGLLFESVLSARPALNLLQVLVRFDDAIPEADLRAAWEAAAAHHAALRLVMDPLHDGGPCQTCLPRVAPDLATLTVKSPDEMEAWLEADRRQGVDFAHAPAWRVRLLRLASGGTVMVWSFHHALLDGNGYRLILREVLTDLAARRAGGPLPQPASAGDGFLAHCEQLARMDHAPARAFFQAHLAGFEAPNQLPKVFAPPPEAMADPQIRRVVSQSLNEEASAAIRARATAAGASMADLVSLAWGIVLARATGRDEAVFGITRANRRLIPEGARSAGCMINTLPRRLRLHPGLRLDALLREQRAWTEAIRPLEATPLSEIAAVCDAPKDRPLFDSILVFDRRSLAAEMREATGHMVEERSQMASVLMLAVSDDPCLELRLEHDPARISDAGAARLAAWLCHLLQSMAGAGDAALADLTMLSPAEEARLDRLSLPDDGVVAAAEDISARISAMARQYPDHPAVIACDGGPGFDHGTLDRRANHLALQLAAQGIGPGDLVGLALPRSADHVVALLAVLKAGAGFVPLDASYPQPVLEDLIARSGARLILSRGDLARALTGGAAPVLAMEDPALIGEADAAPQVVHDGAAPAYVIFTSGSTGRPKGVVIPRRAISCHAEAMIRAFDLGPGDQVLQFASLNFDVSLEEILPTLAAGATLHLRSTAMAQSVPDLLAGMAQAGITVANLPTAFWHVLVAQAEEADTPPALPESLRLVIVGGERVSGRALARWRSFWPGPRWLNGYGPTETTITATLFDAAAWAGGQIPIGRPTGHCRAHVLAADGSRAPQGVPGELWIGGAGIASGYLDLPEQSDAAFRPDPFSPSGARLYRSGDGASWRADGNLDFHGRIDRQIKLRGFRIEPGEIEALLEARPELAEVAVGLDRAGEAGARLMAWIRPHCGESPDPAALRRALGDTLPPWMIPEIVFVEALPRTPGGKVDLAALPRPEVVVPLLAERAPASPEAEAIAGFFAGLLGRETVDPDQSFFDLGGNSLLAVRLMGQLERRFGQRPAFAQLYRAPTARALAAELSHADGTLPDCLVPIRSEGSQPPIYAIHILGPQCSFFHPLATALGPDQPFHGLTFDLLGPDAPTRLEEIAAIYCAAIARHTPQGPVRLIAVSQGAWIAFEIARQMRASGREVDGLFLLDADGPGAHAPRHRRAGLRHYVIRLRRNFRGVLRGQYMRLRREAWFRVTRLRLRISRGIAPVLLPSGHDATAHQAAIDLAISAYRPQPYAGEITVFRAAEDAVEDPRAEADALGWAVVAEGGVRLIDTAGGHLTLLKPPHVQELAGHLRGLMARRRQNPPDAA